MAARRISQETFDEVVRENVEEFDMVNEDAIKEAIAQFRKQGIDLSNIDLTGGEGRQQLIDAIAIVQDTPLHVADEEQLSNLIAAVTEIKNVCDKSHVCSRRNLFIMEEEGGFNALQWHLDPSEHLSVVLSAVTALADLSYQTDFTRDHFEPGGSQKVSNLLSLWLSEPEALTDEKKNVITTCLILCKVASRSEINKNSLMKSNLGSIIVDLLLRETERFLPLPQVPGTIPSITAQSILPSGIPVVDTEMWEKICHVIRGLSTFDDLRAEMSCAGDNGKFFVKNSALLNVLLFFSNSYLQYPELAGASLAAIRSFVNTNEAVQVIAQHGVLELLLRCLRESCSGASDTGLMPVSLVRAVASLVRNIAADDHRKEQLVGLGVIEFLHGLLVLEPYRNDAGIVEHVFGSFAQITLRAPGNAQRWMSLGAADVMPNLLRKFSDRESLQRQACLSVRNIAGRCPELHSVLLDAGMEGVLRDAGKLNGCVDEAYSALRDLGCDVQYVRVADDGRIVPAFEQFGSNIGKLNFRPVFEATDDLDRRIEDEGSAPFAAGSKLSDSSIDDHDHAHHHHHHESSGDCGCR